jgi:valyl-tRNA synthetase
MAGAADISRRDSIDGIAAAVTPLGTLALDRAASMDIAGEKQRLVKELEALSKHIAGTEARLANSAFTSKAPPDVLAGARRQLAEQQAKQVELRRLLESLG